MTKLQLIEGSNAKLHVTTEFSSSNYPKIIYGEPLFEQLVKFRFEFEFKFEFELKTEKEKRKKEKEKASATLGQPWPLGPISFSSAQASRAHSAGLQQRKKRKNGSRPANQAHGHLSPRPRRQARVLSLKREQH